MTAPSLFHKDILKPASVAGYADRKKALDAWVLKMEGLLSSDKVTGEAALMHDLFEGVLGYSTAGNVINVALDKTPAEEKFFDLYLGDFVPGGAKPAVAIKMVNEPVISEATEDAFKREAWRWAEMAEDSFYCLTNMTELRLYPRYRKDRACERFVFSNLAQDEDAFKAFLTVMAPDALLTGKTMGWIYDSAKQVLEEKLSVPNKTVKELYGPVFSGTDEIDPAFFVENVVKQKISAEDGAYDAVFKESHVRDDLDKWQTDSKYNWVIYMPPGRYNIDDYPLVKELLEPHRERLEKRTDGLKWYELPERDDINKMLATKMGFSSLSHNPTFAVDKKGGFYDGKSHFLPGMDFYLVALMNTTLYWYLMRKVAGRAADGKYEIPASLIESLPVPDAGGLERGRLGQLADYCHNATADRNDQVRFFRGQTQFNLIPGGLETPLTPKLYNWFTLDFDTFRQEIIDSFKTDIPADDLDLWNAYFDQEKDKIVHLHTDLARAEHEINQIVYELFGLTQDEIDIIERMV